MEPKQHDRRQYHDAPQVVVDRDSAPEPATYSSLPEAWNGLRRDGLLGVYATGAEYYDPAPGDYSQHDKREDIAEVTESTPPSPTRRVCGLKRKTAVLICIALAIVVVVAVVVGAVLGTSNSSSKSTSPKPSSSAFPTPSPLPVLSGTGIGAIAEDVQGRQFGYYQDDEGSIVEAEIKDGSWQSPDGESTAQSIVAKSVEQGSPLAALSWSWLGADYRLVFFIDSVGRLTASNRTTVGGWSSPSTILTDDEVVSGSIGIEAYVVPGWMGQNALRVYYGATSYGIREVGWGSDNTFNDSQWSGIPAPAFLIGSDSHTGFAGTSFEERLNLYFRNRTTGGLTQWSFGYSDENAYGWQEVVSADIDTHPIAPGSDVTACTDSSGLDWVFYRTRKGELMKINSDSNSFSDPMHIAGSVSSLSKLQALCNDVDPADDGTGAVIYYQLEDNTGGMSSAHVAQDGAITSDVVL